MSAEIFCENTGIFGVDGTGSMPAVDNIGSDIESVLYVTLAPSLHLLFSLLFVLLLSNDLGRMTSHY